MSRCLSSLVLAALGLVCFSQTLQASVIDPVSATATDNYGSRVPAHTIDGSGLSGPGPWQEHTSGGSGNTPLIDASMYLSNGSDPTPTITWNLGSTFSLTGFHVWNYNEGYNGGAPGDFTSRGIQVADVQVSNSPTFASFTDLGNMTLARAPGLDTYTGETLTFGSAVSGQYVRFVTQSNYGDPGFTGLSEIRFIGTPEPGSLVLCSLGAVGLLLAARRRRLTAVAAALCLCLTLASVGSAYEVYPVNNDFSNPALLPGGFGYWSGAGYGPVLASDPTGWTLSGNTGVTADNSGFGMSNSPTGQAAIIQNGYNLTNTLSQPVSVNSITTVTFSIELRPGNDASVDVSLGGHDLGTYTPLSGNSFNTVTTSPIVLAPGTYNLTFTGVDSVPGQDNTVFLTGVSLATTPEPSSLILSGLGAVALLLAARRRRKG